MTRREFIILLGGAAVAWPLSARAQQGERMRRIGALMPFKEQDAQGQEIVAALRQGLSDRGWTEGRNLEMKFIVALPGRHRVPAIYGAGQFTSSGGLISYGPNITDTSQRAVGRSF